MDTNHATNQFKTKNNNNNRRYRPFLSQLLAVSVKNLLLFDWGLCTSFAGIAIPALTGILNEQNQNEYLSITATQASWIGSVGYIVEPVGSIISAFSAEMFGRKRAMLIANIPFTIGWFLLYNATSVAEVFGGIILLGFSMGLIESPIVTFIGEVCEPRYRGLLISYSNIFGTIGMLVVFLLNTLMPWRSVAFVCLFVPIITTIALFQVPETPLWLLSKNRVDEAEKSLCWLRGWASKEAVSQEFNELQRYSQRSKSCHSCMKQSEKCPHPLPTMLDRFKELRRRETLKPFFIVMALFFIALFSGIFGMTPFIVQIFKAYESPIAPDQAAAIVNIANNLANLTFMCLLRFTGKRRLYLTMLMGTFLSSVILCGYGFAFLPAGYTSFDQTSEFTLEKKELAYIPLVCIISISFCTYCGVNSLPWQILSETFPYKTRGTATGLAAASTYLLSFIATKTYYNLETSLSLPGMALFNAVVIAIGLVLMYNILPETENRSLEAIEIHFSDKNKKLTDHKIPKIKKMSQADGKPEIRANTIEIPTRPVSLESIELNKDHVVHGRDNRGFTEDH